MTVSAAVNIYDITSVKAIGAAKVLGKVINFTVQYEGDEGTCTSTLTAKCYVRQKKKKKKTLLADPGGTRDFLVIAD